MATGSTDPNARGEDGATPLHHAVMGEDAGAAESLLEAGAEVDARDKNGWTPLHWAARHAEDPAVLGVLTRAGAEQPAHLGASFTDAMLDEPRRFLGHAQMPGKLDA